MSTHQTDIKNIADAFDRDDLVEAINVWMQSYHKISPEQFMECAKRDDFESPSEMIESIDNIILTLKLAKELIAFHYKIPGGQF